MARKRYEVRAPYLHSRKGSRGRWRLRGWRRVWPPRAPGPGAAPAAPGARRRGPSRVLPRGQPWGREATPARASPKWLAAEVVARARGFEHARARWGLGFWGAGALAAAASCRAAESSGPAVRCSEWPGASTRTRARTGSRQCAGTGTSPLHRQVPSRSPASAWYLSLALPGRCKLVGRRGWPAPSHPRRARAYAAAILHLLPTRVSACSPRPR